MSRVNLMTCITLANKVRSNQCPENNNEYLKTLQQQNSTNIPLLLPIGHTTLQSNNATN